MKIFIPLNTPSSKNSKRLAYKNAYKAKRCNCCGHIKQAPIFIDSKVTSEYKKKTADMYAMCSKRFRDEFDKLPKPVVVSFEFVRESRRTFDYINPMQTVQDIMVKNEWITDDDVKNLIPLPEIYSYDKNNSGVYITLNPDMHEYADRIDNRKTTYDDE